MSFNLVTYFVHVRRNPLDVFQKYRIQWLPCFFQGAIKLYRVNHFKPSGTTDAYMRQ